MVEITDLKGANVKDFGDLLTSYKIDCEVMRDSIFVEDEEAEAVKDLLNVIKETNELRDK